MLVGMRCMREHEGVCWWAWGYMRVGMGCMRERDGEYEVYEEHADGMRECAGGYGSVLVGMGVHEGACWWA